MQLLPKTRRWMTRKSVSARFSMLIANIEDVADDASGEGAEDGDDADEKKEYVKKEFVAQPYECTSGVLEEVQESIIKESRPLLKMRISRQRREFGQDGFNLIDGSEVNIDVKPIAIKNITYIMKKKVLDIGL